MKCDSKEHTITVLCDNSEQNSDPAISSQEKENADQVCTNLDKSMLPKWESFKITTRTSGGSRPSSSNRTSWFLEGNFVVCYSTLPPHP